MSEKYIALAEEASGYGTYTALNDRVCFKILSESINTTREDYYPETAERSVVDTHVKGVFRAGGDFDTLVDPYQFPKLLVYHMGDPTTTELSTDIYSHKFEFGSNESVSATELKSFTIIKGVGIEKDRRFDGGFITSMELEARAREIVGVSVSVVGDGQEIPITASGANYIMYSGQRYLTFADVNTMTIGGTDRLTTAPTIEAFSITLSRGFDTDHYVLGNEYMNAQTLHGFATVEGSMDFTFNSQDEHERFLSMVGSTGTGEQSGHMTVITLQGDMLGTSGYNHEVSISIPETYYTASENAVTARDRIIHTVNYRGNYHGLSGHACMVTIQNDTSSYVALANEL